MIDPQRYSQDMDGSMEPDDNGRWIDADDLPELFVALTEAEAREKRLREALESVAFFLKASSNPLSECLPIIHEALNHA